MVSTRRTARRGLVRDADLEEANTSEVTIPMTFPLEVLTRIIHRIPLDQRATLATLLTVSKRVFTLTIPRLYGQFVLGASEPQRNPFRPVTKVYQRPSQPTRFPSLKLCRRQIRSIHITAHLAEVCRDTDCGVSTTIDMDILRIDANLAKDAEHRGLIHTNKAPTNRTAYKNTNRRKCLFLNMLRPRTIIYRNIKMTDGDFASRVRESYNAAAGHGVLVLEGEPNTQVPRFCDALPLELLAPPQVHLTVVFRTESAQEEWSPVDNMRAVDVYDQPYTWVESLLTALTKRMVDHSSRTTLVNVGAIDSREIPGHEYEPPMSHEATGRILKEAAEVSTSSYLAMVGKLPRDIEDRKGLLQVISMRAWLNEEDWRAILGEEEVKGWLEEAAESVEGGQDI